MKERKILYDNLFKKINGLKFKYDLREYKICGFFVRLFEPNNTYSINFILESDSDLGVSFKAINSVISLSDYGHIEVNAKDGHIYYTIGSLYPYRNSFENISEDEILKIHYIYKKLSNIDDSKNLI